MSEKEAYKPDQVLDHDFDGIQEYDNRLPNWWLWTLWGTIVFSVGYWFAYETYGWALNPVAKYEAAMEAAGPEADLASRGLSEADLVAMSSDPAVLASGQEIFTQYCQVCHLAEGQGLVGPNLTDDYWIHGGRAVDIHKVIVDGVVEKGMAAWGRQLGPDRVDAVVAHVLTFRGKNIEGKEPQGELFQPEPAVESPADPEAGEAVEAAADEIAEG